MSSINRVEPSFGAVKLNNNCPNIANYLDRLPMSQSLKIEKLAEQAKNCKIDVYLSTVFKNFKERLVAEVAHKSYVENSFQRPDTVISRAIKMARKLEAEQDIQNKVSENMSIPNLY